MTEMSFIDKLCSPTRPSLHQAPLFFFFPFQEKRSAFHSSSIFDRFPRFRKPAGRDVSLYLNGGGGLRKRARVARVESLASLGNGHLETRRKSGHSAEHALGRFLEEKSPP